MAKNVILPTILPNNIRRMTIDQAYGRMQALNLKMDLIREEIVPPVDTQEMLIRIEQLDMVPWTTSVVQEEALDAVTEYMTGEILYEEDEKEPWYKKIWDYIRL